jgi:hypothetical protein
VFAQNGQDFLVGDIALVGFGVDGQQDGQIV